MTPREMIKIAELSAFKTEVAEMERYMTLIKNFVARYSNTSPDDEQYTSFKIAMTDIDDIIYNISETHTNEILD